MSCPFMSVAIPTCLGLVSTKVFPTPAVPPDCADREEDFPS